jgi:hypothetical protein
MDGLIICRALCCHYLSIGLRRNRTNRLHEGCGEEWESGDVVWLGLCLDCGTENLASVRLLAG